MGNSPTYNQHLEKVLGVNFPDNTHLVGFENVYLIKDLY